MAIFSRRKGDNGESSEEPRETTPEVTDTESVEEAEPVPHVGISVSTFGGPAPDSAPPLTEEAEPEPLLPDAADSEAAGPTMQDNVLVRAALAALPETPESNDLVNVARQLLQGDLYLRVMGDARQLLDEGKDLPTAMATIQDRPYAVAYSSGQALQASLLADGVTESSAVGQPSLIVVRHATAGEYDGLILDPHSDQARAVLPRALLDALLESADPEGRLKTALARERTGTTSTVIGALLTEVPLWVAVNDSPEGGMGIAEARDQEGQRYLELYSHPLEVFVRDRGDKALPISGAQLGTALRADEDIAGVILDAQGPWIALNRADLAPVLALPEPE